MLLERWFVTHSSREEGAWPISQGHRGSTRVSYEEEEGGVGRKERALIVVSLERNGEAGPADLSLASWNNFSEFWGTGAVSNCLVSSPGVIGVEDSDPP